jgi:hypothetical protein
LPAALAVSHYTFASSLSEGVRDLLAKRFEKVLERRARISFDEHFCLHSWHKLKV